MSRRHAAFIALSAGLLLAPWPGHAQSAQGVLAAAIRSYQSLDLDDAAGLLTRALTFQGSDALSRQNRSRALMYLAATELLRDHRDSAFAVSRRLASYEPRYRPSDLDFPPRTIALYDSARRVTPAVFAAAPADTALRAGEMLLVRLFGSTYHQIQAALMRESGTPLRILYAGPITDSLDVRWDGRDSSGATVPNGEYRIAVESRDAGGRLVRSLRLPLSISRIVSDTLPSPQALASAAFLPERRPVGPALGAFAPAVAVGAAVLLLPNAVAGSESNGSSKGRLVVGATATLAGIYALFRRHPGDAIPENVARNQVMRVGWRAAADSVARANIARRRDVRLRVRAGEPVVQGPEAP